jgi:type IV secretory pathway TrbD component
MTGNVVLVVLGGLVAAVLVLAVGLWAAFQAA